MYTPTYEPARPLRAPDTNEAFYYVSVFGEPRVDYGSTDWPSRSYWIVPSENN